ncbi:hypothetical protein TraAM80_09080 [Trypanosoma rangeli]|uniref:Uncharacterized protein n=1 Tax=Trypanosoma rangeli TaxID=5698 RepID=A0A3R7N7J2_TRYRA|nr:uncharacterized protein TraAM80_09080 [Trypanosoma rangeli]RNE97913.1 hypothetical protein TraAM80_09080 [Trypanosoma rangeli]|eukprot:RNE97913.1 hypothetical protein TraAM80_09080 [Trypanosoma rangeli]
MRASAKVWLQEQRRQRNALPSEEETRIRRLKERLQLGFPLEPHDAQHRSRQNQPKAGPSVGSASLLEQNAVLVSRLDTMEELLRHGEEERRRMRSQLLQASDENRRCAMQLVHSALDRYQGELVLEERLFRETLLLHESEAKQNILWELNRCLRGGKCTRASRNDLTKRKPRLLLGKQFYA